jgi:perosamine synthetase
MIKMNKLSLGVSSWINVAKVLRSGHLVSGPFVTRFEKDFSEDVEGCEAIAVNSGTSALHLMLLGAGIGTGDEIIVPSFSFAATANAVSLTGATPIFADIELDYYCIDVENLEKLITPKTKGIMVVHLFGHPANMRRVQQIADKYKILVFEDAAQAHGASINDVKVGTFGLAAAFSFYATKNVTSGEGGMVTTADPALARRVKLLRNQGMEKRYMNEIVGLNNRLSDLHAAIGVAHLKKLSRNTKQRIKNAEYYNKHLKYVILPKVMTGAVHVYHQYTIRVVNREEVTTALTQSGIEFGIYYPTPIHQLESFKSSQVLPNTSLMAEHCLSIPIHPRLKRRELRVIVETINSITKKSARG